MRILLTGALGQLGTDLVPLLQLQGEVIAVDRGECDLGSCEAIKKMVAETKPSVIVNTAAYTAVDEAEANADLAHAINEVAPGTLAEEARKLDAMFVHYSTDYVFDGTKRGAYTEDDAPAPLNVYGKSKLSGERAVAAVGGRHLVLRTSWVYGANGKNFLLTIRRLARDREELRIVDDQVGAPTSSMQLAQATASIVRRYFSVAGDQFPSGLYHATAGGCISWCGFARAIVDSLRQTETLKVQRILAISTAEYPTPARRPLNSALSNDKFESTFGFRLENWRTGLEQVVKRMQPTNDRDSSCTSAN